MKDDNVSQDHVTGTKRQPHTAGSS